MNVALINFLATLAQVIAGFGAPLISMPFMIVWLGASIATPLSALVGLLTAVFVLAYYRQDFNIRAVIGLLIPAIIGVPAGVWLLHIVNQDLIQSALGVFILLYSLYALINPALPALEGRGWTYVFGLIAGIMGGALNSSGPIVVVYAAFRKWPPNQFRSNLQGFFLVTNIVIIGTHAWDGNLTQGFWDAAIWAIPGMAVAILVGLTLGRRINIRIFRWVVLLMLIGSGISLLI